MDPRIYWLLNDLRRDGEIVVADPADAELTYRAAAVSGMSGISLDPAYVLRCQRTTYQEGSMRDRVMQVLLLVGVALMLGIVLGGWATTAIAEGLIR